MVCGGLLIDGMGGYEGLPNRLRSLKVLIASAGIASCIGLVAGMVNGGGSWTPFIVL